ncbi:hypothetical protein [Stenotrophomonas sp.]|uniref:hypothetical protein n=1 Tax=Stenotrophomonas sp. TaxID=69392 RepID=UPI00289FD484|nr:hypothetical protein [Stenotrophomonas sp.]
MSKRSWSIPSNRGWEVFTCELLQDAGSSTLCDITVQGQYMSRSLVGDTSGEIVPDFDVRLPQVRLDRRSLRDLHADLVSWREEGKYFSRQLEGSDAGGQKLRLYVGPNDRFVREVGKEALGIEYRSGLAMSATWQFLIDQSCAGMAAEELAACLESNLDRPDAKLIG